MLEDVVFQILHRAFAPNKKKCVAIVQHTHFIRGHQLPSGSLKVGGVASAAAFGLAVGVGVNGLFPKQLGHILVGGLLIAAKIQKSVTIAYDAFPLLVKERFQLGQILEDDADGNFPASHGGKKLIEIIRQGHVGKLVHDKVDMDRQPPAMLKVRLSIELLEQLGVEHSDDEVVGAVTVGDHRKDGGFPFSNFSQLHFIRLGDSRQRSQVELFQMGDQGDLNGFQRLAAAGVVALVVPHGDMLRVFPLQPLEQLVQGGGIFLVVLFHITGSDHVHDHGEVLLLRGRFVVKIGDQGL